MTRSTKLELHGFGDHAPLYILVDSPTRHMGDSRSAAARCNVRIGDDYQLIHVISRPAGGEIRGYVLSGGVAVLRRHSHPEKWPEVDAAVAEALRCEVKSQCSPEPTP